MSPPATTENGRQNVSSPKDSDFEDVVHCYDERTGLESVIAVHDTALGPSLGGIRMLQYPDHAAVVADAKRLAEAMSYNSALAGVEFGGGKSVINARSDVWNRDELLLAHGRKIEELGGRYIPAVDMGTVVADLDLISTVVSTVSSRRRDPAEFTARSVVAAIREAVQTTEGTDLAGKRVGVSGVGQVGSQIAFLLAAEGALPVVADIDEKRSRRVAAQIGATIATPRELLTADCDVLCPCAVGGVITEAVIDGLRTRYLIGASNNMLADPSLAVNLRTRDITHVPDFVSNAGGLIACAAEVDNDDVDLRARVERISGDTTRTLLAHAADRGLDTVTVAMQLARERMAWRRQAMAAVR
ncbi:Glu/Leu/Phe/Val dehydrogenase dimerization domain-containing protein [Rhodococcus erythropolis]|uniref:Glu/Leu/Phe/Val dehydrogenase dimerization domain-containing protein n=1 Tax=Rhodococcus erythropolis TaxID=1833 RepID=UPI002949F9D4|nr:Glu/Leu/Phe/Val dehydrogenase dimerization domain-containing protein [Rhodococcus erythropolis]MDV6212769.1 Glu/Leu/Phe/Val dehydrogenase dimerization domain-containing protein [Rhodococcus erythropolis]